MTNHPNRSQEIETIAVQRSYDSATLRPCSIYRTDLNRQCTAEELRRAVDGQLRMVETTHLLAHPSYGRSEMLPDGSSRPVPPGHGGGGARTYTLTPGNIAEFLPA